VDRADLERFVTFFREFVDLGHHDKEETILVPALVRHGFHWDDGPVAWMRREHDQERYLMRSLRHAALQKASWSEEARRHWLIVAREFISFLRSHTAREEQQLFPEAARRLPDTAKQALARDFEALDAQRVGDAPPAPLRALGAELTSRYARTS
jgi:hemerythrin-like domain-containing protein